MRMNNTEDTSGPYKVTQLRKYRRNTRRPLHRATLEIAEMSIEPVIKTLQSSDGTIIHAEFAGDLSKPCVVFVHGATMSSLVFDGVFRDPALLREVCMVGTCPHKPYGAHF